MYEVAPYVDFAVWGPHGHRIQKKISLTGMHFNSDGSMRKVELFGPPDLDTWCSCYDILTNALVMLDVASLGPLQE